MPCQSPQPMQIKQPTYAIRCHNVLKALMSYSRNRHAMQSQNAITIPTISAHRHPYSRPTDHHNRHKQTNKQTRCYSRPAHAHKRQCARHEQAQTTLPRVYIPVSQVEMLAQKERATKAPQVVGNIGFQRTPPSVRCTLSWAPGVRAHRKG